MHLHATELQVSESPVTDWGASIRTLPYPVGARGAHLHGVHDVVTASNTLTAKLLLLSPCPNCLHSIMLKVCGH